MTDNDTETVTQLPLLGDIPGLGWLFKNKSKQKTRSSLIVFVTPQIIRSPDEAQDNLQRILDGRRQKMKAEYEAIFGEVEEKPS